MSVFRVFIEKKKKFAVEAENLLQDLRFTLRLDGLTRVRVINRYDAQGLTPEDFAAAKMTVFGEPQVDNAYDSLPNAKRKLAVEYLPGQYDQRADSAAQCIQLATQKERPIIRCARVYLFEGEMSNVQFNALRDYLINPVDSREASEKLPETLTEDYPNPPDVAVLSELLTMPAGGEQAFIDCWGLAMDVEDLKMCRDHFVSEGRAPTITEIRMIDTYWSDHCRHTTFSTHLEDITIEQPEVKKAYARFSELRHRLGRQDKPVTLMEIATIGAKALRADGRLPALDVSEEINACSVRIPVVKDKKTEEWVLMFKNETHNHPTEIEPFGGAATCLGGAIRDPLSGRSYVYQAMRLSGGGNPLASIQQTRPGKLPQRKIALQAAAGYSSYGNQIGLATGLVHEFYHPGYIAKRMEVGAVIAAAPAENIRRERPSPGDVVLLIGGGTGRDGCGGATGSSKAHDTESLTVCGAEVQKGNAPEERKLQRLFRNPAAAQLMKRCNDFGAGGVSVAVGELAEGLDIDLDAVPKKYEGLDGTELAISESQERMAVVTAPSDAARLMAMAAEENLNAVPIAVVTDTKRLRMRWRDKIIVDIKREFLDTNGAKKTAKVHVSPLKPRLQKPPAGSMQEGFLQMANDLNLCSKKGLIERFDASIGASAVLAPLGGRYGETPAQVMASKIPLEDGDTKTASVMSFGFDPFLSEADPFSAARFAVAESVAKAVAAGGSRQSCWLSFQEYFGKPKTAPERWGLPFAALLGALDAQMELGCGAIGGKDSMSGSFEEIDVPPTLISFAVSIAKASDIISSEFKREKSCVALLECPTDEKGNIDLTAYGKCLDRLQAQIEAKNVLAAWVCSYGGIAEGIFKMAVGNRIGVSLFKDVPPLFAPRHAAVLIECIAPWEELRVIGETTDDFAVVLGNERVGLEKVYGPYANRLTPVYPHEHPAQNEAVPIYSFDEIVNRPKPSGKIARPRVLIPVFPGTNCEVDTARAFARAGALPEIFVVKNRFAHEVEESALKFAQMIEKSQIIAIPGGFSGGDEPDGSGKFITAFFRNPRIAMAVTQLLEEKDGLMLGICNGFQALVKLGLVPYGKIMQPDENLPTLTYNRIGRHQARLITTRLSSVKSPWMMYHEVGQCHVVPVSHGEGRFVANRETIEKMAKNGQIVAQYVDENAMPTMKTIFNPNESCDAIESISSPDGRVLAKMAHSERAGEFVHKNIPGDMNQRIFEGGVHYFSR
jgi:phosphoribosylformylglycinamidine synthase